MEKGVKWGKCQKPENQAGGNSVSEQIMSIANNSGRVPKIGIIPKTVAKTPFLPGNYWLRHWGASVTDTRVFSGYGQQYENQDIVPIKLVSLLNNGKANFNGRFSKYGASNESK